LTTGSIATYARDPYELLHGFGEISSRFRKYLMWKMNQGGVKAMRASPRVVPAAVVASRTL